MKRPTLLLMLVILASIFLFFLLNLLLGSVHIPFRSVWNILWGNTDAATGATLKEARAKAYEATEWVQFDNKREIDKNKNK